MGIDPLIDPRSFVDPRGSRQGEFSRYDQCGRNFAELQSLALAFAAKHSQTLALSRQGRATAIGGHDEGGQCDGEIKVALAGGSLKSGALIRLTNICNILPRRQIKCGQGVGGMIRIVR